MILLRSGSLPLKLRRHGSRVWPTLLGSVAGTRTRIQKTQMSSTAPLARIRALQAATTFLPERRASTLQSLLAGGAGLEMTSSRCKSPATRASIVCRCLHSGSTPPSVSASSRCISWSFSASVCLRSAPRFSSTCNLAQRFKRLLGLRYRRHSFAVEARLRSTRHRRQLSRRTPRLRRPSRPALDSESSSLLKRIQPAAGVQVPAFFEANELVAGAQH